MDDVVLSEWPGMRFLHTVKAVAFLLLSSCAASQTDTGDDLDQCGPTSLAEEGCPIDPCAAECSSVASGISCCVEAYGRGNFDDFNLERLMDACSGSDCDPDLYLSPDAALCVAQVYGLESGIGWCGSSFDIVRDDAVWDALSTYLDECADGDDDLGDVGHDLIRIDARTGEYFAYADQIGLAECAE